jgi:hypothetical protein
MVCVGDVCCSPEGTRSKTGQLMRFKKGPFYIQHVREHTYCWEGGQGRLQVMPTGL